MDTPRKWQIASVATAVASMSIGGVMLARPTNEAVASIDLELVTDSRELSLASPGRSTVPADGSADTLQIVSPEAIEGPVSSPAATSVDSPDTATTSGSTGSGTTSDQTEPSRPAPSTPPPDDPSSDSASSVDSPSSIDS